jgi:hypothetical protein
MTTKLEPLILINYYHFSQDLDEMCSKLISLKNLGLELAF